MTFKNDKSYYYQFAKVTYVNSKVIEHGVPPMDSLGINIDIFPLDGMPENKIRRRIHQDCLMLMSKIRTFIVILRNRIPSVGRCFLPYRWTLYILDIMAKKYSYYGSTYVGNILATTVRHKEIPNSFFSGSIYLEFEKNKYPAPKEYKKYLRRLYGDYMKYPPKEKQVSHHHFEAYILSLIHISEPTRPY